MIRIYIRKSNERTGHVFVSHWSIKNDKVAMLPFFPFVRTRLIDESEWACSQQPIAEKFKLYISETRIDGRKKLARSMKPFSWREYLTKIIRRKLV